MNTRETIVTVIAGALRRAGCTAQLDDAKQFTVKARPTVMFPIVKFTVNGVYADDEVATHFSSLLTGKANTSLTAIKCCCRNGDLPYDLIADFGDPDAVDVLWKWLYERRAITESQYKRLMEN